MVDRLVSFALSQRFIVVVAMLALAIWGVVSFTRLPIDAYPDLAPPRVQIVTQYVKDLSFENPGAPTQLTARPNIELGVDLSARQLEGPMFEVAMKLTVNAKPQDSADKSVFLVELTYAGLFQIVNVPQDVLQQVLLV